jgi:hypothetical protein
MAAAYRKTMDALYLACVSIVLTFIGAAAAYRLNLT